MERLRNYNTETQLLVTVPVLVFETTSLTPWIRVLLQKLTVTQLVKKLPHFLELEGSLLCSQEPAPDPCPEPHVSSQHPHALFFKTKFDIYLSYTPRSLQFSGSIIAPGCCLQLLCCFPSVIDLVKATNSVLVL